MIQKPDHDQVFPPREIFINGGVLSGEPDQFANLVRILHDIETFYMGLAFIRRDRKSTRLNSSHSSISYAVFFLKKSENYTRSHDELLLYMKEMHKKFYLFLT